MFLHLIHPNAKFVPLVRDLFEAVAPEQNVYVVYNPKGKDFSDVNGVRGVCDVDELREIYASRDDWQGVVVNGMCESLATTIDILPPSLKF